MEIYLRLAAAIYSLIFVEKLTNKNTTKFPREKGQTIIVITEI